MQITMKMFYKAFYFDFLPFSPKTLKFPKLRYGNFFKGGKRQVTGHKL